MVANALISMNKVRVDVVDKHAILNIPVLKNVEHNRPTTSKRLYISVEMFRKCVINDT